MIIVFVLIFLSVTPPKLFFELPTEFVKNTFVGFVLPNKRNDVCFFKTLVDELKKEQTKVKEMKGQRRSFQQIFETVKTTLLKDNVGIDHIDDFDGKPIYLFGENSEQSEKDIKVKSYDDGKQL